MKRLTISLTILVLLIVGFTASAYVPVKDEYWNQISEDQKFNLTVRDYSNERTLQIAGFYTRSVSDLLWKDIDIEKLLRKWWGDRKVFTMFVAPYSSQYFWPTEFTFVQNGSQYDINYEDIAKISDSFIAGELKDSTITNGFVAIPAEINTDVPFTLWYDDEKVLLK